MPHNLDQEFEFRNREFPIEDLFHVYETPEPGILNRECFMIYKESAKYFHGKNNNLMPTRFEFVLVPKYEKWEDDPEKLNMVLYQQTMDFFEAILNHTMEKHRNSSPMSASLKDPVVFRDLNLQVPVSLLDPEKIDSVHMANMYRKYVQEFK